MSRIITINRQFSSGGREVAKRLADKLSFAYYDKEIIEVVAEKTGLHENYIEKYSEAKLTRSYPFVFARTFSANSSNPIEQMQMQLQIEQSKLIKELSARGDCVIVGRCAGHILRDDMPFKIFIYSSNMDSRIKRCYEKVPTDKGTPEKQMKKMILDIDKNRAAFYSANTEKKWDDMSNYNLCIDTYAVGIKKAVDIIITAIETK